MKTMFTRALTFFIILIFTCVNLYSQSPTKWRGPDGNGVYNETGLLNEWPAAGPDIIWSYDGLGEGHSSPAFANNTIYLTGMEGETGYVYALTPDGSLKWKKAYGEEFHESYPGARSTPVVSGNLLYAYSGNGLLTCMDAENGDIKWQKSAFDDFDGKNIRWGVTETVVIDGDKLYFTPGGEKHNVVALNRITGEHIWSSAGMGEVSAYCTPLIVDLPSRKLLVTHTADHIIGIDTKDGKMLWSYPQTNRWQVHANTPIFYNGDLFCFSGYGQGGVKLNLSEDGSKVEKAWFNENLDSRIGGMVVLDGYLYGSGDKSREWRCVNWETGEETYASKEIGKGVVIAANNLLIIYSDRGELALAEATPEGLTLNSQTSVELGSAQHWAHPVINNGLLYVRHGNTLIAYKTK